MRGQPPRLNNLHRSEQVRFPQLVVYETDGLLARALRPLAREQRWLLREPRRLESCLAALANEGPAVVVLKAGRDLSREFELLQAVAERHPDVGIVVISDNVDPAVELLAWDLGASYVLTLVQAGEFLRPVVKGLMAPVAAPAAASPTRSEENAGEDVVRPVES